jgi:hypothetical protein
MVKTGGSTRLQVSLRTGLEVDDIGRLLDAGGPDAWLGDAISAGPAGRRRYATDLKAGHRIGTRLTVHKSAYVDIGSLDRTDQTLRAEVSWRSASLAPLFPVFSGWLTARPGEIAIDGRYVPPGGALGSVADRALMHRAARYTADWLLRELARAASGSDGGPGLPLRPGQVLNSHRNPSQSP